MEREYCKVKVYRGWDSYRCRRYAVRDGFCAQHHPDAVQKRQAEAEERWEIQRRNSASYRLEEARKRIAELENELKTLRGE